MPSRIYPVFERSSEMAFSIVFYITFCSPDVKNSVAHAQAYVDHGMKSVQFDMPSRNPVFETPLVKGFMQEALAQEPDYRVYMDAMAGFCHAHPQIDTNLVVYPDVVDSIGRENFVDFIFATCIHTVMIAGGDPDLENFLRKSGIAVIGRIDRYLSDESLRCAAGIPAGTFNLNYKKHAEVMPHGCVSFADKIRYIRNAGVTGRIQAVEGISSVQKLQEVIDAGADGAIIGNALMNLWDDEARLWPFFDSLVACAGGQGGFGKE